MKKVFNDAFTLVKLLYPTARYEVSTSHAKDNTGVLIKISVFTIYVDDNIVFRDLFSAPFATANEKVEDAVCMKVLNTLLSAGILTVCKIEKPN